MVGAQDRLAFGTSTPLGTNFVFGVGFLSIRKGVQSIGERAVNGIPPSKSGVSVGTLLGS